MESDWTVRPATEGDRQWIRASLLADLGRNSYFHAVTEDRLGALARRTVAADDGYETLVACTADDDAELVGWVQYAHTPTLTIVHAIVEPAYRGLGAWRALRDAIGLRRGQLVNVVLAGPSAMAAARKRYVAKHNWGRVLEWLL